jgi:acetoacetate decarboxylase
MYLDDDAAIAGGRELWGFPKKRAQPKIRHEGEVIVGTLHYGTVLCATAPIGYKHRPADRASVLATMQQPNFIRHVDGGPRICELVQPLARNKHQASPARTGRSAALSTRRGRCRALARA